MTSSLHGYFDDVRKLVVVAVPLASLLSSLHHLAVSQSQSGQRSIEDLTLSVDVCRRDALQPTFASELLDHALALQTQKNTDSSVFESRNVEMCYPAVEAGGTATGAQDEVKLDVLQQLLRSRDQLRVAVVITEARKLAQETGR